jgi:hypothetical protein
LIGRYLAFDNTGRTVITFIFAEAVKPPSSDNATLEGRRENRVDAPPSTLPDDGFAKLLQARGVLAYWKSTHSRLDICPTEKIPLCTMPELTTDP